MTAAHQTPLRGTTAPSALDPTPSQPGLRISAAPIYRQHDDRARWFLQTATTPTAAAACSCGYTATARGTTDVAALVAAYTDHRSGCRV
ncbi:hypothetical protein [Streptomyces sp. NPDC001389]|uniref:hypothetical protein n=1 Tax=Streptomyces sp. NPDC001389 TaxID=3364569 RepID=UPI0036A47343